MCISSNSIKGDIKELVTEKEKAEEVENGTQTTEETAEDETKPIDRKTDTIQEQDEGATETMQEPEQANE